MKQFVSLNCTVSLYTVSWVCHVFGKRIRVFCLCPAASLEKSSFPDSMSTYLPSQKLTLTLPQPWVTLHFFPEGQIGKVSKIRSVIENWTFKTTIFSYFFVTKLGMSHAEVRESLSLYLQTLQNILMSVTSIHWAFIFSNNYNLKTCKQTKAGNTSVGKCHKQKYFSNY